MLRSTGQLNHLKATAVSLGTPQALRQVPIMGHDAVNLCGVGYIPYQCAVFSHEGRRFIPGTWTNQTHVVCYCQRWKKIIAIRVLRSLA